MGLTGGLVVLAVLQLSPGGEVASPGSTAPQRVEAAQEPRQLAGTPWTLRFGFQRLDLMRYNRVEAVSLGARAQLRPGTPFGPLSVTATARFGIGDVHPNGRLGVSHETVSRRIALSGYHELAATDERGRYLGPVNSLVALAGQDDGDYYRRTGATLEVTPPSARHRVFRVRAYAEFQEGVEKETDFQIQWIWNRDRDFRPNISADDGWEYGGSLELSPRFGTDPTRTRGGLHALVQGALGDAEYARARLGTDVTFALPARMGVLLELAGGTSWGSPSVQRLWYVGGPLTLRGYDPRTATGESFLRGRVEIDRRYAFGRVILFSDMGWAGARRAIDLDDALYSLGAGLAVIDDIVRVDAAWGLEPPRGFRLDVYLDQLL